MTWRGKTCEKCVFQVAGSCRRFPPSCYAVPDGFETHHMDSGFPMVAYSATEFMPACAEYAESLDDTGEFIQLDK